MLHLRNVLWQNARLAVLSPRRGLVTLAIETSCDDTSVAIVNKSRSGAARIHFLENITPDLTDYKGIHPILALQSHQENLAELVNKALSHLPFAAESPNDATKTISLPDGNRQKPDFISVTRGPGMRSNLFVGLDTAKGLSVAWQIPCVGVHHMQAHLLTPRLVSALSLPSSGPSSSTNSQSAITPAFPFLSILASGGHTLLTSSDSLTSHSILATTNDVAIGEALDKSARAILPSFLLRTSKTSMFGKLLEQFAFPNGAADYADYIAPRNRGEEVAVSKVVTPYGWSITAPFAQTKQLEFSFAVFGPTVERILSRKREAGEDVSDDERVLLAREVMRVCFEHLASRTILALESLCKWTRTPNSNSKPMPETVPVKTLVVSGGVAANKFLMTVLRSFLDVRGFGHIEIVAPPPALCTDNAAMIGWAGIEMFEAGWRSERSVKALRKWSLDPAFEGKTDEEGEGGVLGVQGWVRRG
ncbi:glycoprotease family-domain-containing protein [Aspergillus undulatus]|uniref:glycoprotease family-domain-containing protein n=1 Tax=Aspergillus undulatus TaxID=1810928 RepID=UPI003CCCBDFE